MIGHWLIGSLSVTCIMSSHRTPHVTTVWLTARPRHTPARWATDKTLSNTLQCGRWINCTKSCSYVLDLEWIGIKSCNCEPQAGYIIHKKFIWRNVCPKYENGVKWNKILLSPFRDYSEFTHWTSNFQPVMCIFHSNLLAYKSTALV